MGFLLLLGLLHCADLILGEHNAVLSYLSLQGFEPFTEGLQVMAHP